MIAEFQSAPVWAQVGMVFFAITAVVMVVAPRVTKWKFRRHFDEIARGLGLAPATSSAWPITFSIGIGDRPFEVRHNVRRVSNRGAPSPGPHGYLLTTACRLAGAAWSMQQVDIAPVDGRLSGLMSGKRATGDTEFDGRFIVTQDGAPVRDGWLDGGTRQSIARFFDHVPLPGLLWIRQGELQFIMQNPWKGIDGQAIRGLLERQAVLASALERTAG